jgi:hypothetical protein
MLVLGLTLFVALIFINVLISYVSAREASWPVAIIAIVTVMCAILFLIGHYI